MFVNIDSNLFGGHYYALIGQQRSDMNWGENMKNYIEEVIVILSYYYYSPPHFEVGLSVEVKMLVLKLLCFSIFTGIQYMQYMWRTEVFVVGERMFFFFNLFLFLCISYATWCMITKWFWW